jgi:hypothetical protein
MTSILTGDIIDSRTQPQSGEWMGALKKLLNRFGKSPLHWEIYRGDEFQLEIPNPEDALLAAFEIKALMRMHRLDVRISIGIGDKSYTAKKISESNGTAFVRSGESFEQLKKQKLTLVVNTGNSELDAELNLMIQLALTFLNSWLPQSAELFITSIRYPNLSQEELGAKLGIAQAAVSRRRKRSQLDLVLELDKYYRKRISKAQP